MAGGVGVTAAVRKLLARWRAEDASVAEAALAINLGRLRWMCPLMSVINLAHVLAFLWHARGLEAGTAAHRWTWGLLWLHLAMGVGMVACAVAAHQLRYATRSLAARLLTVSVLTMGLCFAVAVVTVDQWITPAIAPFLITCMLTSLALHQRPPQAAWLYGASGLGFYVAMGWTQPDLQVLLSNRLNGAVASVLGFSLSVLLWRNFTTLRLQQRLLETANTQLQQKQRDLERLTRLDGLTGLFNRNTFVELTRQELDRAQRQGSATAILLLDLDHFKKVNDTWGHPAGDAVLRHVAAVATGTVRSTDLVGRLGGEEFIVLLPSTTLEAARKLAEKLRSRLQASPAVWGEGAIAMTCSIGLSATTAQEKRNFDTLYNEADKALYLAKTRGRNRVVP